MRLDGAPIDRWGPDDLGRLHRLSAPRRRVIRRYGRTNIARFEETASSEAILEAARLSGAHEMILRLSDGYDTRIGERGTRPSAGQRQRIGLARAVFGRPFLIVLDEPNANLDAEGENALVSAIATLRSNTEHRHRDIAPAQCPGCSERGNGDAWGARSRVRTA